MAERSLHRTPGGPATWRLRVASVTTASALALAGLPGTGTPPPPEAPLPDRVQARRFGVIAPAAVPGVPRRTMRWFGRLRSALPGIGRTPSSRADNPALPTVGRPRDGPRATVVRGSGFSPAAS